TAIVGGMESNPSALSFYGQPPQSMGSWEGSVMAACEDLFSSTVWDSPTKPVNTITWTNDTDALLFNVYRDGVLVCPGISRLYYVDSAIVPGKAYKYEIESVGLYKAAVNVGPK